MRAFHASKSLWCEKNISIQQRLRYFDTVMTPVACYASGHRAIYKEHLDMFDVALRKLLRSVVGPPGDVIWDAPWHEILHKWNRKVVLCMERRGMLSWSQRCLRQHWKLAGCIANFPSDCWVQRISQWCPVGRRSSGRLPYIWTSVLESFGRYKPLGTWTAAAQNTNSWMSHMDEFMKFCSSRDSQPDA